MELMTVREAAGLLRVGPGTVRRWIASRRLAAVRVGREVRVRRDAVEGVLAPAGPRVIADPDEDEAYLEGRELTEEDSLFRIIGLFDSGADGPTDVSFNKHTYLAEAYADLHDE